MEQGGAPCLGPIITFFLWPLSIFVYNKTVTFKSVCILKGMGLFFQESTPLLPEAGG
jgi:hypothetical protein